jgi:DNA-binding transcriptional ArsR family regulator
MGDVSLVNAQSNPGLHDTFIGEVAGLCKALAHPSRIAILQLLREGARSVTDLQSSMGLRQPVVSQHLALLRAGRLVRTQRAGRKVLYDLVHPGVVAWFEECLPLISRTIGIPAPDSAPGETSWQPAPDGNYASAASPQENDDCL